ncbi:MAG: DNA polymerase III subunit beta [Thermodesulfovibrionaceae bacterium]
MKIKVKKREIQESIAKIQNIVEKKSIMPILNHFLLEVTESCFILATDLETAVKQPISAQVFESGNVCVPAKKFYEIIKELEDDIDIELIDSWLKIQSGKSLFKLATLDSQEFPVWPHIGESLKFNLTSDFLLTAIEKTLYAAGEADARYVLNGLLMHLLPPHQFRMVATDGHRLALITAELPEIINLKEEKRIILSKKSLNELRRFLSDAKTVTLNIGKTHIMFEIDGVSFLTRMIEGEYPRYENVIPRHNEKIAFVQKDLMISSLKRVSVLSREHQNAVKTEWSRNTLIISSSDPELGEAKDEIEVEYKGEFFEIGFNAEYLIEALEEMESSLAKIAMDESDKAVYLTDANSTEVYKYECVIMPLRL